MSDYVRVKLHLDDDKNIVLWAKKRYSTPFYYFTKVDKYGNQGDIVKLYIACEQDIIWEKPAKMNKKYAEIEIINENRV